MMPSALLLAFATRRIYLAVGLVSSAVWPFCFALRVGVAAGNLMPP